jgi:hypothetical protein
VAGTLIASDDLPLHAYAHHGASSLPTLRVHLHARAHHGASSLPTLRAQAEAAVVAAEVEAEVAQVAAAVAGGGAGAGDAAGKGMAWAGAGLLVATCAQVASEALTQVSLVNCLLSASDCVLRLPRRLSRR